MEDDLEFSWLVVAYVKKRLNLPVRVAQDYVEATRLIGSESFDLVVCGITTPEVASSLLRFIEEHTKKTRMVLFTSQDRFDRIALAGPRFLGHIPKTKIVELVDLMSKVN